MRAWLQRISGEANRIFGEIIGDRAATLSWQDDYDIVLRVGANERHFAQLSGGEQMSAALAVRLALLHRLTRSTLVIFDEPTQNMDGARRANLADQIRRVRDFEQVLVISHDDTFEEGLDSVIWVQKDDGASRIESEQHAALTMPSLLALNAESWSTALKAAGSAGAVKIARLLKLPHKHAMSETPTMLDGKQTTCYYEMRCHITTVRIITRKRERYHVCSH